MSNERPRQPADVSHGPALSPLDEQNFLQRVLAASPDCIKVLSLDGNLLAMNAKGQIALELDDLTPHLGTCWSNWWQGANREAAELAVEEARAGRIGRFEAAASTFKGNPRWWDVTVTAIPGKNGEPERLLSVSRDVTAQHTSRDTAAERLDRLRSVIESAKDYAVISITADSVIDGWSAGAAATFGWSEAEAIGKPFGLIWTEDDRKAGKPAQELTIAKESGSCPDSRFHVRADGRRIFVAGACRPVRNAAGHLTGFVKVCRDETEARALQDELTDARRRLDAAMTGGLVATWVWEVGADRLYGDRNMFTLFNLPDDGGGGLPLAKYVDTLHPDDRPSVMAALERTIHTGEDYVAEYRIVTTDPPRWAYARARLERDSESRPARLAGMVADVTDRKLAESALRAERELLRTVFDQAPDDAILIMDADRVLTAWNPAAERITGWTAAEAVRHTADIIFTPEDRAAGQAVQETTKAAKDGKTSDERWHNRKDGSRFWGSGTMNALHHSDGTIRGYLKVFRDATERHEHAETLAFMDRLTGAILGQNDPEQIIGTVERLLGEHLKASRVLVAEASPDGQFLTLPQVWALPGLPALAKTHRIADYGERLIADYRAGRMHIRRDSAKEYPPGPQREAFVAIGATAAIDVPVLIDGQLRALLVVHQSTPRDWTDAEIALVRQVADRVFAEVDRARALREMQDSEARMRAMVTASSDALYRMSPDWSEMWQMRSGAFVATIEQPSRTWLDDYIYADDQPQVLAAIARAIADKKVFELEHRVRGADGTVGWTASRAVPLLDAAGRITEWFGAAKDITEAKRAEADRERFLHDLATSERRRRMAAEAADVGSFHVDPATGALETDATFRRLFGASDSPLSYEQAIALIHPDDRETVQARAVAAIDPADGRPYEIEYRVVRPGGSVHWVNARGRTVFDETGAERRAVSFDGTVTDVTDRKQAEADLAFQRHQLELIFRESPAAMALWRGDNLVFERANPEYHDLFRGRPLVGLPLLDALPELRGQGFDDLLREVMRTGRPFVGRETLARVVHEAGGPVEDRYFDFTYLQVCDADGHPYGVYDHSVDVTDRVMARQALEESQQRLREALAERQSLLDAERAARSEAEQAGRMKDEFLATLSHELRTPLNAIVGWTQILRSGASNAEDLAEGLSVIDRNARAQTQIIEDILDMSRIVSGKLRLDVQRLDLGTLVKAGADTVRPAADAKGVRLQVLIDPSTGTISGDPGRLHQVLWNLISNAVKFTPRGGRVQIVLERVNSHVEVNVTDTGEGIAPEFLPHVFDRFRQADASTTRRHGGLGLGLSIVKQLVELHGGSVRVKSPGKGQGATFTVVLPLTLVHAEPGESPEASREHPTAEIPIDLQQAACDQLAGVSIVAVDDEADGVAILYRLLSACGATVRTATSAAEALALVRSDPPKVLISDIGMPGEDGYALIQQVRALPPDGGGQVYALALTAYARAADRVRALEAGFQMHLAKPVESAELIVSVAALAKMPGAK